LIFLKICFGIQYSYNLILPKLYRFIRKAWHINPSQETARRQSTCEGYHPERGDRWRKSSLAASCFCSSVKGFI